MEEVRGLETGGKELKSGRRNLWGVRHTFIMLPVIIASEMHKYVKSSQMYTLIIHSLIMLSNKRTLVFWRYTLNVLQKTSKD